MRIARLYAPHEPTLFCCCDRAQFPPPLALCRALLPLLAFTVVLAALLATHPLFPALAGAGAALHACAWALLLYALGADPGRYAKHVTALCMDTAAAAGAAPPPLRAVRLAAAEDAATGARVEVAWCGACRVWRPPTARHCTDCNFCVEAFDHHCGVLGKCVGAGNFCGLGAASAALCASGALTVGHAGAALAALPGGGGGGADGALWVAAGAALGGAAAAETLLRCACAGGAPPLLRAALRVTALCGGAALAAAALRAGGTAAVPPLLALGGGAAGAAGGAALAGGLRGGCPRAAPRERVDFAAPAAPLLAALDAARDAHARHVLGGGGGDDGEPPPPPPAEAPWAARCSDAVADALGGTAKLPLARALAAAAVGEQRHVVGGWDFLPAGLMVEGGSRQLC
jgi:hypothetical protein